MELDGDKRNTGSTTERNDETGAYRCTEAELAARDGRGANLPRPGKQGTGRDKTWGAGENGRRRSSSRPEMGTQAGRIGRRGTTRGTNAGDALPGLAAATTGYRGSTEAQEMLREVKRDEESHGRIIRDMISPIGPQGMLDVMLRRERWHKRGGGWLGDAIYGANDGLGAVFGIVSGVAGYTGGAASNLVLISGLAGMMASALSMGSGAFLATKSEREVFEAEIGREK